MSANERKADYQDIREMIDTFIEGNRNGAFGLDEARDGLREFAAEARQEAQRFLELADRAERAISSLRSDDQRYSDTRPLDAKSEIPGAHGAYR